MDTKRRQNDDKTLSTHFKASEFACPDCGQNHIHIELVQALESVRDIYQKPIVINSGYRCQKHNKEVGGVPNSAHTRGWGSDLRCEGSRNRFELLRAIMLSGKFNRVGIGKDFIHVDLDPDKDPKVAWLYQW